MNALVDSDGHPRALSGLAGGRADPAGGARHLLPAARSARGSPRTSASRASSDGSSSTAASFAFGVGDEEEIFISSADWMPRNFFRRVELMIPILDEKAKEKIRQEILEPSRTDNSRARDLQSDGVYVRREPAGRAPPSDAQQDILDRPSRAARPEGRSGALAARRQAARPAVVLATRSSLEDSRLPARRAARARARRRGFPGAPPRRRRSTARSRTGRRSASRTRERRPDRAGHGGLHEVPRGQQPGAGERRAARALSVPRCDERGDSPRERAARGARPA